LLLGEAEQAQAMSAAARAVCATVGFRSEAALKYWRYAELLLNEPDEHAEAIGHLDITIAEFRDWKMQPSLERAPRHKEVLRA
jgi:hypothetical protein